MALFPKAAPAAATSGSTALPRKRTNTPLMKAKTNLASDTAIQAIRMRALAVTMAMMESLAWLRSSFSRPRLRDEQQILNGLTVEICSAARNDASRISPVSAAAYPAVAPGPGAGEDAGRRPRCAAGMTLPKIAPPVPAAIAP